MFSTNYMCFYYLHILTLFIYHSIAPWMNIPKLEYSGFYKHAVPLDVSSEDVVKEQDMKGEFSAY